MFFLTEELNLWDAEVTKTWDAFVKFFQPRFIAKDHRGGNNGKATDAIHHALNTTITEQNAFNGSMAANYRSLQAELNEKATALQALTATVKALQADRSSDIIPT